MIRNLLARGLNRARLVAGASRTDQFGALYRAWGYVTANQLVGDYLEFGVFRGRSLVRSHACHRHFVRYLDSRRVRPVEDDVYREFRAHRVRFIGFDTFSGMPGNDEGDNVHAGSFRGPLDEVRRYCSAMGLEAPALELVPGLFSDTLPHFLDRSGDTRAVIVNIDCDLYQSTADVLLLLDRVLRPGAILLFDDFNLFASSRSAGERRALAEWEARGAQVESWFSYGHLGHAFIYHGMEARNPVDGA